MLAAMMANEIELPFGLQTMVAETKRQLEDFLNSVERDTDATFLDKSGKDAIHGHNKRKLGSMKRGLLRGWCPDVCVGHAAGMLATQTASYQYESLLVAFSFKGTANQLRGKIDTAVEGPRSRLAEANALSVRF
ncbi:TPA: hypothetical protein ACH3X1_009204 [Trebouxia sp. C0004]